MKKKKKCVTFSILYRNGLRKSPPWCSFAFPSCSIEIWCVDIQIYMFAHTCMYVCLHMYVEAGGWHCVSSCSFPPYVLRHDLSLTWSLLSLPVSAPFHHHWNYRHSPPWPAFLWVVGIQSHALMFSGQARYQLGHLPALKIFKINFWLSFVLFFPIGGTGYWTQGPVHAM